MFTWLLFFCSIYLCGCYSSAVYIYMVVIFLQYIFTWLLFFCSICLRGCYSSAVDLYIYIYVVVIFGSYFSCQELQLKHQALNALQETVAMFEDQIQVHDVYKMSASTQDLIKYIEFITSKVASVNRFHRCGRPRKPSKNIRSKS